MEREIIDLSGLQSMLKEGVEHLFPSKLWLKAEIGSIKARPGGHCYLELTQNGESGLVAKANAVIWSSKYRFIAPYFESVAGSPITEGMSVLICVRVTYSQLYGLSLSVEDIDPEFSLGALEKVRLETIARLEADGLMDMQKSLAMPLLPYRFAVISASDAAGYGDFVRHLHENQYGFVFQTDLFPALMQGFDAPKSMSSALDAVAQCGVDYDAVLILRGGGSATDLSCFDDYGLCSHIAQFPLPVLTAVGHDRDYHVCDMVAWSYLKTPTALADEIIGWYCDEQARVDALLSKLKIAFSTKIYRKENDLQMLYSKIKGAFAGRVSAMENVVNLLEARIMAANPMRLVERGFVLALNSMGGRIRSSGDVRPGDELSVMFADGIVKCSVNDVQPMGDRLDDAKECPVK